MNQYTQTFTTNGLRSGGLAKAALSISKIIRVLTVAPIMALVMTLTIYFNNPALFGGTKNFLLLILFLTVLPLLAYPLQPIFKTFRDKGREGQRTLAMIFAVCGYVAGLISALALHSRESVRIIYICYLLSGILVVLANKLFKFRASGHACGIVGPFALLLYFGQQWGFLGIPILAAAWWASIKMKRHTAAQLLGGMLIPLVALALVTLARRLTISI